jgi:hypothetical protein
MAAFGIATSGHLGFTLNLSRHEVHRPLRGAFMNTTTFAPPSRGLGVGRVPRPGAVLLALARRSGLAVWRGLEAYGRAKAQRELRDLHDRWETSDPTLARQLRVANAFLVSEGKRQDA